jgi:hypothetical protein
MWHAWERRVKCIRFLVGNSEGKITLVRPRRRWEDGIRMNFRETGWRSVEWIQLAQDRDRWRAVVNTVMNLQSLLPVAITVHPDCSESTSSSICKQPAWFTVSLLKRR